MNLISICEKLFKKNSKNQQYTLIFILLVVALFPIAQTYAEQSRTGVMIPLYLYPSQEWNKIVDAKTLHPNVPIVAVINPNNGPGTLKDTNFDVGINQLKSSGVIVLGYTHTDYATRDMNLVIADINSYKNWYNLDGIKFDEMTHTEGNESYYANLNSYVKSLGYTLTAGNPGSDISQSYVGTVDTLTIFENSSLPKLSNLGGMAYFL